MKKIELGLFFILVISTVINNVLSLNIIGFSALFILSLYSLCVIYLIFGFSILNDIKLRHIFKREAYKNLSGNSIFIAIFTGWALSTILIGYMFKIMLWPGGKNILISGGCWLIIVLVIALFVNTNENKSNYEINNQLIDSNLVSTQELDQKKFSIKKSILQRVIPGLVLGIIIYFI